MYARIIALLTILSAIPANAENLRALEDRHQAIEIHADRAIRQERQGLTAYKGNVLIQQGSLRLEADAVTISQAESDSPTEIIASGQPAKFSQQPDPDKPLIHAWADTIYYHLGDGKILLDGNARLEQGEAQVSSARIEYLISEQVFSAGSDRNGDEPGSRVQVIIPAQQRKQPETETDTTQP